MIEKTIEKKALTPIRIFLFTALFAMIAIAAFADMTFAKTNDETAPVINSITIHNAEAIDAQGEISFDLDITEEDSGVSSISVAFYIVEGEGRQLSGTLFFYPNHNEEPLFTGVHTLTDSLHGDNWSTSSNHDGKYKLFEIGINDRNGNQTIYYEDDISSICNNPVIELYNTQAIDDTTPPELSSLKIIKVNANPEEGEKISLDFDVIEEGIGLSYLDLVLEDSAGIKTLLSCAVGDSLRTGHHTIHEVPIDGAVLYNQRYTVTEIKARDAYDNTKTYVSGEGPLAEPLEFVVSNSPYNPEDRDIVPPVVNSFVFPEKTVEAPGAIPLSLDITEEESGMWGIALCIKNDSGSYYTGLRRNLFDSKLFSGQHTVQIPISPYVPSGTYTVYALEFWDEDNWNNIETDIQITINNDLDVAYSVAIENMSKLMEDIGKMTDGQITVVDCRDKKIVPKEVFEAIAGRDVTLVFQCEDMQWVFDGKKIDPAKCKDVDLTTSIHVEDGTVAGFENDEQVLVIDFADNGELPGEAEVRINDAYISAKYSVGTDHLMLSYVDGDQITLEDSNVSIEADEAAVLKITHNSRFVLSSKRAATSISKAKIIVSNRVYNGKAQKPSIKVVLKGRTLSARCYKITGWSGNKYVGTATVTVKGISSSGYTGTAKGHFYINPKKAVISSVKAGKRKIVVTMKTKPSSTGGSYYKIQYRVAGSGSWKSTTTTGKSKTISKLRKGKKYQVRVTAIKGSRKGAVSAIKRSGKVK